MIIFLDRDGTINEPGEGYITNPNKIYLLPNAGNAIKIFNEIARKVIVVTNQSIIGRGLSNHRNLRRLHTRIDEYLDVYNAHIDHYLYCFHGPNDGCACRKPKTKMFEQAKLLYDFNPNDCWMIGDNISDIEFGKNCKMKTGLVETGYGKRFKNKCNPDFIFIDLLDAAIKIKEMIRKK